jgi:hypothetical protein
MVGWMAGSWHWRKPGQRLGPRSCGIFVAYRALVLWKCANLPRLIEWLSALCSGRGLRPNTCVRGQDQGKHCGQWVQYSVRSRPGETAEFAMGEEGKEKHEEFLRNDTIKPGRKRTVCPKTYRECVPHHLAVHELVADITPYESPGRDELHAQQPVHCGTVSATIFWFWQTRTKGGWLSCAYCPSQRNATKLARAIAACAGLQSGHELPSLSSAIRARGVGPGLG